MFKIISGTVVLAALALNVMRLFAIEKWLVTLCLVVLALCLYLLNTVLIQHYIKNRAPEFANDEMWELTAGTSVVPKWVSTIGLFSISALIAAVLPWIIALFKLLIS